MVYKGYLINPDKSNPKLYSIATEGRGGKIPNCLGGLFTTRTVAFKEIDRYLGEKANAKEAIKSRD